MMYGDGRRSILDWRNGRSPDDGRDIEQVGGLVVAAAEEHFSIGAEGDRIDDGRLLAEGFEGLPCGGVPELDGGAPTGERLTVRAEGDRVDALIALQCPERIAARGIP